MKKVNGAQRRRALFHTALAMTLVITGLVSVVSASPAQAVSGYYYLWNVNSELDVVIKNASTANLAPAIQWAANAAPPDNDQFKLVAVWGSGSYFMIQPVHTLGGTGVDKCLAVQGGSLLDGAAIVNATCTPDYHHNDIWHWSGGFFRNVDSSKCMVVKGASTTAGASIVQWECNYSPNGLWKLDRT